LSAGSSAALETTGTSGEPVIAAARPAQGWPAFVVVAQDLAAIRSHTLRLVAEIASLALVGLAIAAAVILLWWRAEKRRVATELRRTTERAEQVEARLSWLSRDANDIILLIGFDDRIIDANERAVAAYGRSMEELVGLPAANLRPPDPAVMAGWQQQMADIERLGSLVYETTHCRRDGSTFPVEISARVLANGGRVLVQSIVRDVTERKEQQARIQKSEAAYRSLFQANPHPMWAYDVETLRFLAVNDAAVAQYGYSEAEFLGMTIEDIRPPEELPRLRANLAEGGDGQLQRPGLWVHRRRNGELIDVEIVSHGMNFAGRRARVVLAHDVTQRVRAERRLRASEERYRRLFDQASDGVLQFGADGTVLDANAEAQHMFGYTQDEFRAAGIQRVLAEKERGRFERLARSLVGNAQLPAAQQQWRLVRNDGSRFTAEVRTRALDDGTFIATIRDLTEVLAAQQRLAEQRELRAAKDRAESADRAKTAFLRSVSHELRSPLHSIIGFTAALLEGIGGGLNAAQRELMQIVNDSARHLLDIINDLLDVSRIEAGAVSIEARPYRPADVLRRVMQRFSLQAAEKQLDFRLEADGGDLASVGDERRVEQVVSNLVSNAIKFTMRGAVTVGVRVEGDRLHFEVSDTGRGIAPADQSRLFNYFSQLDPAPDSLTQGTGLGLAIAMGLAEAMDGDIEVRSEPGRGSRFALVLPLRAPVAA
jgi:PAS domain S-box-containing protein